MQDSSTLVVVALVGLAVVCLGVFFVAFVMLLRFAGSRPLGLLSMLLGERDSSRESGRITTMPPPDLRAIADANDFDAALAKHRVLDGDEPRTGSYTPAQAAPPDAGFDDIPSLKARKDDRRGNVRRDDDDDLFGDMLD